MIKKLHFSPNFDLIYESVTFKMTHFIFFIVCMFHLRVSRLLQFFEKQNVSLNVTDSFIVFVFESVTSKSILFLYLLVKRATAQKKHLQNPYQIIGEIFKYFFFVTDNFLSILNV